MAKKRLTRKRGRQRRPSTPKSELARRAALEALSLMRTRGLSRTKAAKEAHTTPATVMRYAGAALRKDESGKYRARPSDRIARALNFLTHEGRVPITVRSSRTASRIAEYMAAVRLYTNNGDTSSLSKFRGRSVRAGALTLPFVTDPRVLDRLYHAGEVAFEDLYASST